MIMTLMMTMNIGGGFANFDTDENGDDHDDNDDDHDDKDDDHEHWWWLCQLCFPMRGGRKPSQPTFPTAVKTLSAAYICPTIPICICQNILKMYLSHLSFLYVSKYF